MQPVTVSPETLSVIYGLSFFALSAVVMLGGAIHLYRADLRDLSYRVKVVPPKQADEYREANPGHPEFADFANAVLANPHYVRHHERMRKDALRYAVEHIGMVVFVKAAKLPEA